MRARGIGGGAVGAWSVSSDESLVELLHGTKRSRRRRGASSLLSLAEIPCRKSSAQQQYALVDMIAAQRQGRTAGKLVAKDAIWVKTRQAVKEAMYRQRGKWGEGMRSSRRRIEGGLWMWGW